MATTSQLITSQVWILRAPPSLLQANLPLRICFQKPKKTSKLGFTKLSFPPFSLGLHEGTKLRASERGHAAPFSLFCLPQLAHGGLPPVAGCVMTPQRYQVLIPAICVISSRKSLRSYDQIYRCDWVFKMGR